MNERITADQTIYQGHMGLHRITIEQQGRDGSAETLEREVAVFPAGAVILLREQEQGRFILTRQFRPPLLFNGEPSSLLECCAGVLQDVPPGGDTLDEARRTACREAEEETGWHVQTVTHLFSLYTSPGVSNEVIHFFVGECDERRNKGGGLAEEGEAITTVRMTLEEVEKAVADGDIRDAKTLILLQHMLLQERNRLPPG